MFRYLLYVVLMSKAVCVFSKVSISSPGPLIREVGQDVVFMFNATSIEILFFGIRDGNTDKLKQGLIYYDIQDGMQFNEKINSTSYAGRVSVVGDLSKGQAWFKIINLNINDTNMYLAQIDPNGEGYKYASVQLTVIQPVTTTTPSTSGSTTLGSLTTQHTTTVVTTAPPPTLTNLTTNLTVDQTFSEEMRNMSSSSSKDFSKKFENAIKDHVYSGETKLKAVKVISLRNGSIHVTFIVIFESKISYDQACSPLEKAIEKGEGKLGSFEIVPGSLGCSKVKPESTGTPRPPAKGTGVHPGIIAGVAVVGVLAIAGLVITIIFVCRKKSSKKDYRSSKGPGQGYRMEIRHGEPEEQYASVQRPGVSDATQSRDNDQPLPQYAAVDKSKKKKKPIPREPGELVYAELDHDFKASIGARPPSNRRQTGETGETGGAGDTVYADLRSGNQQQQQQQRRPPPKYGNIHDLSYA